MKARLTFNNVKIDVSLWKLVHIWRWLTSVTPTLIGLNMLQSDHGMVISASTSKAGPSLIGFGFHWFRGWRSRGRGTGFIHWILVSFQNRFQWMYDCLRIRRQSLVVMVPKRVERNMPSLLALRSQGDCIEYTNSSLTFAKHENLASEKRAWISFIPMVQSDSWIAIHQTSCTHIRA